MPETLLAHVRARVCGHFATEHLDVWSGPVQGGVVARRCRRCHMACGERTGRPAPMECLFFLPDLSAKVLGALRSFEKHPSAKAVRSCNTVLHNSVGRPPRLYAKKAPPQKSPMVLVSLWVLAPFGKGSGSRGCTVPFTRACSVLIPSAVVTYEHEQPHLACCIYKTAKDMVPATSRKASCAARQGGNGEVALSSASWRASRLSSSANWASSRSKKF